MLKIAKTNFFVNEEKRTVVGKLIIPDDDELFDFAQTMNDLDDGLMDDFNYENLKDSESFTVYEAKAKCSPEDEWDVEKGKRLVNQRLGKMVIQRIKNQAKEEKRGILKQLNELDEVIKECEKAINISNKHIEKIIKGEKQ